MRFSRQKAFCEKSTRLSIDVKILVPAHRQVLDRIDDFPAGWSILRLIWPITQEVDGVPFL